MKRFLSILALIFSPMLLSACASLESAERQGFEVRGDYIAAVERAAKRSGVEVIWLNPPTQRRTRDIEWTTQKTVEFNREPDQ